MDENFWRNGIIVLARATQSIFLAIYFSVMPVSANEYLKQTTRQKHLDQRQHDKDWMKKADLEKHFASISSMLEISDGSHKITLCHYPMMTWNGIAKGSYHIYAHIHNNTDAAYFQLLKSMHNALNAGVDVNHFRPVTFAELVKNNQKFKDTIK